MVKTIAFVTPGYNPRDVRRGSGTFYYLAMELEHHGCALHFVGPIDVPDPLPTRFFRAMTRRVWRGRYPTYLDPWVARARGRVLARLLDGLDYDLILTNDHGVAAGNQTGKPVIVYTDVMLPVDGNDYFAQPFSPFYKIPNFITSLFRQTIRKSLEKAILCVFPAEWQKALAITYGAFVLDKTIIIPFGANIPDPGPDVALGRDFQKVKQVGRLDVLFVGKDWLRKGGPLAVEIVSRLRQSGLDAVLHVVGPALTSHPDFVHLYGLLDKNNKADWKVLDRLYRECQIFLFPSQSEGSAIVPREASAYGLPTLAYRIDGLIGAVENGVSGFLLEPNSGLDGFVSIIQRWVDNPQEYQTLSHLARRFYEEKANWAKIGSLLSHELSMLMKVKGD